MTCNLGCICDTLHVHDKRYVICDICHMLTIKERYNIHNIFRRSNWVYSWQYVINKNRPRLDFTIANERPYFWFILIVIHCSMLWSNSVFVFLQNAYIQTTGRRIRRKRKTIQILVAHLTTVLIMASIGNRCAKTLYWGGCHMLPPSHFLCFLFDLLIAHIVCPISSFTHKSSINVLSQVLLIVSLPAAPPYSNITNSANDNAVIPD